MRDSDLPHPHLACIAVQAAWFLLSPAQQQLVANPVVSDMVWEWWKMAVGCGIFHELPNCSGVRENLSAIGRKPGIVMGNSGPLGQKGGSERFAEEKVGVFPGAAYPLCPQAPHHPSVTGFSYLQVNSCCHMGLSDTVLREII